MYFFYTVTQAVYCICASTRVYISKKDMNFKTKRFTLQTNTSPHTIKTNQITYLLLPQKLINIISKETCVHFKVHTHSVSNK